MSGERPPFAAECQQDLRRAPAVPHEPRAGERYRRSDEIGQVDAVVPRHREHDRIEARADVQADNGQPQGDQGESDETVPPSPMHAPSVGTAESIER